MGEKRKQHQVLEIELPEERTAPTNHRQLLRGPTNEGKMKSAREKPSPMI
jgi:hypothetical protein